MVKVSVVIPVYNVEKYLSKCLDSVCNQTLKDIEIICVNDCSTDNSLQILKNFARKDKRIKIINVEVNKGAAAARNVGMISAQGEYLNFIDSDDWIDVSYIEEMVYTIEKNNCDIVLNTNIFLEYPNIKKKYPSQKFNLDGEFINRIDAINKTFVLPVAKLYRMQFLKKNDLKFPEGFLQEDMYFHHISNNAVERIFVFEGACYHYRQHINSVTFSSRTTVIPYLKIAELILRYYKNSKLKDKDKITIFNIPSISEINTAEEYDLVKSFILRLKEYYETVNYKYSCFENYVIDALINTHDFEEYQCKFGKNLQLSFLRKNMKRLKQ